VLGAEPHRADRRVKIPKAGLQAAIIVNAAFCAGEIFSIGSEPPRASAVVTVKEHTLGDDQWPGPQHWQEHGSQAGSRLSWQRN
jgi:hypothetical protein